MEMAQVCLRGLIEYEQNARYEVKLSDYDTSQLNIKVEKVGNHVIYKSNFCCQ